MSLSEQEVREIEETLDTITIVADPNLPKRLNRMSDAGYSIYTIATLVQRLKYIRERLQQLEAAREVLRDS